MGVFCLLSKKEHRNFVLQSEYTGIQILTLCCCGSSSVRVQTLCPEACEGSLKSCMQAVLEQDKRLGDGEAKNCIPPTSYLVLWLFPIPRIKFTEGKKKEASFGFSYLKSIMTLQCCSVCFFNVLL